MSSPLFDILTNALGGQIIDKIGGQLGLDRTKTASAIGMLVPVLVSALGRNAATPGGLDALNNAVARDHDGSLLDNIGGYLSGGAGSGIGGKILSHVLGNDQAQIEEGVSRASGISAATVGKLLVMLAPILLGALGRANKQTPPTTNIDDILNSATGKMQASSGGGILSRILDRNGDGSAFDDVARIGASVLGGMLRGN